MKTLLVAVAAAFIAAPAYADFVVTPDANAGDQVSTLSISGNDFLADLIGLGFTNASYGASLSVDTPGTVTFYAFASESAYDDAFEIGGVTLFSETDGSATYYGGAPGTYGLNLGSFAYNGSISDALFHVVAPHGPGSPADATLGNHGFAIFYGADPTLIAFGFDDNGASPEDNHDDLVILARITTVPEPASWMMMIASFIGLAFMRRRHAVAA